MSFAIIGRIKKVKRRGQTAIEYILVTVSLLFVFTTMYKALQYSIANQFERGGRVIMRVYTEDWR